jgi:hypothetical protein
MGIIPPSLPWKPLRIVLDAVADAPVKALTAIAAAVPPPRPHQEQLDYAVVCSRHGQIEKTSDAMTLTNALAYSRNVTEAGQGELLARVVHRSVAARCAVGQLSSRVLDLMEADLAEGYALYLESHGQVGSNHPALTCRRAWGGLSLR